MATKKRYLLGADIGSSACKAILITTNGEILSNATSCYQAETPREGWAQQDPEVWYCAFIDAVQRCLSESSVSKGDIEALSVCGPAHNAVLLDDNGDILRPTILWWDQRSVPQSRWLSENYGSLIYNRTFQPVHSSWTLAQLCWVRQNEPDIFKRIARILIGKDYITYRLTGSWKTEWYDAMGTQLLDANQKRWSEEICGIIGLDTDRLPPVVNPTEIAGTVTVSASSESGLPEGLAVAVGSGDSVVEAFGVGAIEPGDSLVKLATTGTVCLVTDRHYPGEKSMSYCHVVPNRYYIITATSSGASSAQWFIENMTDGKSFETLESLAAEIPPGSDGLLFHPYLKGERSPYWDPDLRGDFIGISDLHTREHFMRAILEGVAFSLLDCASLIDETGVPVRTATLVGGGARIVLWRRIVCDVLDRALRIPRIPSVYIATYGAALLAGYATGTYRDLEEVKSIAGASNETIEPNTGHTVRYRELFSIYREVTRALQPLYRKLRSTNREYEQ